MRPALVLVLVSTACVPTWTAPSVTRPAAAPRPPSPAAGAAPSSVELPSIAELEDRRSLGGGRLESLALTSADASIRRRALVALGRLQDPSSADTVVKELHDADPAVRTEAAFAAGLLGLSWVPLPENTRTTLVAAVLEAESAEPDPSVRLVLLDALGRLGTAAAAERLTERLHGEGAQQARAGAALGVAAKNGTPLPAPAFARLGEVLQRTSGSDQDARYGAAYALMQSKSATSRPALVGCLSDLSADVRALCAKGLGEKDVGAETDAPSLKKLLDDPDYRVAVEATRALARLATRCKTAACPPVRALEGLSARVDRLLRGDVAGGAQPLLALAQAPLPTSAKPLLASLRLQLGHTKPADPHLRQDGANLDCRLAAAIDRLGGSLAEVKKCGSGLIDEPRRLALGLHELATVPATNPAKRAAEVGPLVAHADSRVRRAAVERLGQTKAPAAIEKVKPQPGSTDPVLAAAAASALAKLGDKSSIPAIRALAQKAITEIDTAPVLAEALATLQAKEAIADLEPWLASPNATIRSSAAEALTKLKGQPVAVPRVEGPAASAAAPLPRDAKLLVTTEKGELEIELFTQDAPLTSGNLAALARKGYFKNLTFHRVVPDFVVQGGDPRGDGEGGPGYTIRCEINRHPYVRGVVGMALSGKDTGGSQFFVTSSPQPHLDGRYTAFGRVTRGLELVDTLLEGDRITDIHALP